MAPRLTRYVAAMPVFTVQLQVAWGDIDFNRHMANRAWLDHATQTRFLYLESRGFGPREFVASGVGPAISHEELVYRRELALLERFTGELWLVGISADTTQFRLQTRFVKASGELAGTVTATARWIDLAARKVVAPPEAVAAAMLDLARTEDFVEMASGVRR